MNPSDSGRFIIRGHKTQGDHGALLDRAISNKSCPELRHALALGANPNARPGGVPALCALFSCPPRRGFFQQSNPLDAANAAAMAQALLGAGARPGLRDGCGENFLHKIAKHDCIQNPQALAPLLASHKSLLEERNNAGHTPLHLAASNPSDCACEIAGALLAAGGDPNAADKSGSAPLHLCAARPEIAALLLRAGAGPDAPDNNGMRPLHKACLANRLSTVACLLEAGADLSLADAKGRLCFALGNGKAPDFAKTQYEKLAIGAASAPGARASKPAGL